MTFVLCKLCPSLWPLCCCTNCVLHHDLCVVVQTVSFTVTFVLCKLCPLPWPLCCCANCVFHCDLCLVQTVSFTMIFVLLCKLCPSRWPLSYADCVLHHDLWVVQTLSPWPLCCANCVLHHEFCVVQTVSFTLTFVLLLCRLCWPHRAAGQLEIHVPSHCHGGARLQPHCWDHPLCWRLWEHQGMVIVIACGLTGLCGNLRLLNDVFLLHFVPGTDNGWNVLSLYRLFSTSFIRHMEAGGGGGGGGNGEKREKEERERAWKCLVSFVLSIVNMYFYHELIQAWVYILYTSGGDESLASIFLSRLLEMFWLRFLCNDNAFI